VSNIVISVYIRLHEDKDEFDSFEDEDLHIFEVIKIVELPYESSDKGDKIYTERKVKMMKLNGIM
jgi:hypothetical protein